MVTENLRPERVFYYFEQISSIPRGSGNEKAVSDYCLSVAKGLGLEAFKDEFNNVVIKKPASKGYENSEGVIIQGHLDMVCEKDKKTEHDFKTEGIKLVVDGDWLKADGTTLGADNGIAVAIGLALMEADDIEHPPLECLFTTDEEVGMGGAMNFDASVLNGSRLINLDSEEEGVFVASCCGGAKVHIKIPFSSEDAPHDMVSVSIKIRGLNGGHSGSDIHLQRANANKLMGRFLYGLKKKAEYALISLTGGQKDNAITRECTAEFLTDSVAEVKAYAKELQEQLREEYTGSDENITFEITEKGTATAEVLHPTSQEKIVFYLQNVPFGIQKMSGTIKGLVETSSNIGILRLDRDELFASSSVRSSVDAACSALSDKIEYLTEFLGGDYEVQGAYPAWEYRKESPLRDKMVAVFEEMYGHKPEVVAIHAGLECGLFYKKMEGLDCVSLGPDMKDIHTSEEVLSIASTERVWNYLVQVLKNLKD